MRLPRISSRRLAKFGRAREGATAVEFAFVALPLFMLIGVIIEWGIILFAEYSLQNAVQEAGRRIRTDPSAASSGDDIKTIICGKFNFFGSNCTANLNLYVNSTSTFKILEDEFKTAYPVDSTTTTFTPGVAGSAVVVIATYDWPFSFPFMEPFSNVAGADVRRLSGIAVFRNEP